MKIKLNEIEQYKKQFKVMKRYKDISYKKKDFNIKCDLLFKRSRMDTINKYGNNHLGTYITELEFMTKKNVKSFMKRVFVNPIKDTFIAVMTDKETNRFKKGKWISKPKEYNNSGFIFSEPEIRK